MEDEWVEQVPTSEHKRKKAGLPKRHPKRPSPFTVTIEVYDRDRGMYKEVHRKGRMFDVDGRSVLVFTQGVFTEAMDRKLWTLSKWEKEGLIPRPTWSIDNGKKERRMYSKGQVLLVNDLWRKYRHQGKGKHFNLDSFLKEVREGFYKALLLDDAHDGPIEKPATFTLAKKE